MAKLARNLAMLAFKGTIFVALFAVSMRFIHTYPLPMPPDHQHKLLVISDELGVRDPESLYLSAVAMVNLIAATIEYRLLVSLWRKTKKRCARTTRSRDRA